MKTSMAVAMLLSLFISLSAAAPPVTTLALSVPAAMLPGHESGDQADQRTFCGKIVLLNGQLFILRDDINDVWYHLDDQTTARKFAGRNVNVKGTLDLATDVIHIQSIEEQKNSISPNENEKPEGCLRRETKRSNQLPCQAYHARKSCIPPVNVDRCLFLESLLMILS